MDQGRPNWRRSYHEMIDCSIKQYMEWREQCSSMRVVCADGRLRVVRDLTDAQIRDLAMRESEGDLNMAIHKWNRRPPKGAKDDAG